MSSQSPPPPPGVVVCGSCVVVVAVVPIEIETTATVLLESHDGLKSLAYKPISIIVFSFIFFKILFTSMTRSMAVL